MNKHSCFAIALKLPIILKEYMIVYAISVKLDGKFQHLYGKPTGKKDQEGKEYFEEFHKYFNREDAENDRQSIIDYYTEKGEVEVVETEIVKIDTVVWEKAKIAYEKEVELMERATEEERKRQEKEAFDEEIKDVKFID